MHIFKPMYLWAFLALPFVVSALDVSSLKEKKCSEIETPVDVQWMSTVKTWYLPLWSKLCKAYTASDILGKAPAELSQSELDSNSCALFKSNNWIYGFGGKTKLDVSGSATKLTFKSMWKGAKTGEFTFKLTDNKSYILGIDCYEDGQAAWALLSTKPTISADVKDRVMDYVTALGFKEEMAVTENYDKCKFEDDKNEL